MSFAGFGINEASKVINFPIDSAVTRNLEDASLIGKLLEVSEYKDMYHEILQKIVDEYFKTGIFENTVLKLDKLIGSYVKMDNTAFYSYEEYKNGMQELLKLGSERTQSVNAQLKREQSTTEFGNIASTVNMSALGSQNKGDKAQGKDGNRDFSKMENMNPNEVMLQNPNKENINDKVGNIQKINSNEYINYFLIIVVSLILSLIFVIKYNRKKIS
ncbi:MAG: CotH kinase family protein [Sarcina sp.]